MWQSGMNKKVFYGWWITPANNTLGPSPWYAGNTWKEVDEIFTDPDYDQEFKLGYYLLIAEMDDEM